MDAISEAVYMQMDMDKMQLFFCEVGEGPVDQEQMEEAIKGEQQCHMKEQQEPEEVAWDDVNDCEIGPVEVRKARKAEMEYFTKMKVYKKVLRQRCRDMTRKDPIKVMWIDTNKQDAKNPQVQITTRGEGLQHIFRFRALHGHTSNRYPSSST